jgi:hypothetical protein
LNVEAAGEDYEIELDEAVEPYDLSEHFWLAKAHYSDEYASEVTKRFTDHIDVWEGSPLGNAIWQAYRAYHNLDQNSVSGGAVVNIQSTGSDGELLAMKIDHFRAIVRHQLALVTTDRPAWDPQARTNDSESAKQTVLARQLLDYLMSAKRFDQKAYDQLEVAIVTGAGFEVLGWDANAGLDGKGECFSRVLCPWEVAHERVRVYDDCTWWIWRSYESRWEWAARFAKDDPEKARKIASSDSKDSDLSFAMLDDDPGEDRMHVLYVYAKPTVACPNGRLSIVADDDLVLLDGPMPYGNDVPITRMAPGEFLGTSIPYSDAWTLLPIAEAYNACLSAILTRVEMGSVPDIVAPEGSEYEATDFGGRNFLKHPPGFEKPSLLDMLQIPQALPAVAEMLKSDMQELSGINSVTRGNPSENITSGSMAALVQSMAVQFNNPLERTYIFSMEQRGTHLIRIYQQMATEPQLISIAGQSNAYSIRDFKSDDLSQILRVAVKTVNSLSKTTAGRIEMAKDLLQNKLINRPEEYLNLVQTGNFEPIVKGPSDALNIVKSENEMMGRGERPQAVVWDNHQLHIMEHIQELDTKVRYDQEKLQILTAHIQQHVDLWSQMSRTAPDMLFAMQIPPLPLAQAAGQQALAMQGMQGMQGGPPPGSAAPPPPDAAESAPKPGKEQRPGREPSMPTLPKPAKDPMTGEAPV